MTIVRQWDLYDYYSPFWYLLNWGNGKCGTMTVDDSAKLVP